MATSINLERYPVGMLDLLEQICETRKPCTISYQDYREASAQRLIFYGLRRALQANQHSLCDKGLGELVFKLKGEHKKENILEISFPNLEAMDKLYSAIAAKHAADADGDKGNS